MGKKKESNDDKLKSESMRLALKYTGILALGFFIYSFILEILIRGEPITILNLDYVLGLLILAVIVYFHILIFSKMKVEVRKKKYKSPINKWYEWLFYIIGLILGVSSPAFWIYAYYGYLQNDNEENLVNKNQIFHRRVYRFGIVIGILLAISFTIILFTL